MSMPRSSSSRGFTLIEVLIALAIASILVPAITRLAGNTRSGAVQVVANVHAMRIAQSLLDRFANDPKLAAGRYSGKQEGYHWQVDVQPTPYVTRTLVSAPLEASTSSDSGTPGALGTPSASGAPSASGTPGREKSDFAKMNLAKATGPPRSAPAIDWTLVRITAVVQSPSKRSAALEALRLRSAPTGRPAE